MIHLFAGQWQVVHATAARFNVDVPCASEPWLDGAAIVKPLTKEATSLAAIGADVVHSANDHTAATGGDKAGGWSIAGISHYPPPDAAGLTGGVVTAAAAGSGVAPGGVKGGRGWLAGVAGSGAAAGVVKGSQDWPQETSLKYSLYHLRWVGVETITYPSSSPSASVGSRSLIQSIGLARIDK
jgi:hypothetical protein